MVNIFNFVIFVKNLIMLNGENFMNIKKRYIKNYPSDELGKDINPKVTFKELKENLHNVYEYLNVYDSLVRERIFTELSKRMNVDYDIIYNKWLNS